MDSQEQEQLLKRLSWRRLGAADFASDNDLIVAKEGLVLDASTQGYKPSMFKPSSLEDLMVAIGPRPEAREQATGCVFDMQVEQLRRMAQEVRQVPNQPPEAERRREKNEATFSHLLMRAVISGALPVQEAEKLPTFAGIIEQIHALVILRWVWPNIIVRAGSTLTLGGPHPQTVHAYKLIVEPGATIILTGASVTFDCVVLEVQ